MFLDAAEWFRHRSYDYRQFSDLEKLGLRKRELGLTVSAVLPCRNVADTVGRIIDEDAQPRIMEVEEVRSA